MKWIKFERIQGQQNVGTQENPVMEDILLPVELSYCEYNLETAKAEAYKGEYTIEDDGQDNRVTAPRNIEAGEYVTVDGVLYKATANIPNGEAIIVGHNAAKTTIEEQLYELKGE